MRRLPTLIRASLVLRPLWGLPFRLSWPRWFDHRCLVLLCATKDLDSLSWSRRLLWCGAPLLSFNFKSPPPKTAIKVISYNTLFLGGPCEDPITGENNVAKYLEIRKADIACLQEVPSFDGYYEQRVFPVMKHAKYHDGLLFNGVFIAMFSHYPIVRHELVCQDEGNGSVAFWTVRAPGDTILVINNHLKSVGLSMEDREEFKEMVHAPESKISRQGSKTILSKITHAAAARAAMADKVAAFIDRHRGTPMIVCGDFNDTPISYAYRRVGKGLTDAFVSTGRGFGRSFNRDAIFVRIDHMFCSEEFTPYAAYVDSRIKCSDHYPIVAYFEPTKNKPDHRQHRL